MPPPPPSQSMTTISPGMDQPGEPPGLGNQRVILVEFRGLNQAPLLIIYETNHANQANPPPSATSDFIVMDKGNCSPRYMRCTISQFVLQQYDNPSSKKFNNVVNEIRRERCSYLLLRLCQEGDLSGMFFSNMIEDKNPNGPSYFEFLVEIHREIQKELSL